MQKDQILSYLAEVKDPEIPVVDVVEMGIVRDVAIDDGGIEVTITPTYSGCPAMQVIEDEIVAELERHELGAIRVKTVFAPAWTTEWMTPDARQKMLDYGIAPPGKPCSDPLIDPATMPTGCPFCKSMNTRLQASFGSTACKSLHFCDACHQPFEHFKCI